MITLDYLFFLVVSSHHVKYCIDYPHHDNSQESAQVHVLFFDFFVCLTAELSDLFISRTSIYKFARY